MKELIIIILLTKTILSHSFPAEEFNVAEYLEIDDNNEYISIPEINGDTILMHKNDVKYEILKSVRDTKSIDVKFYLYTSKNLDHPQFFDRSSLNDSFFNPKIPTRFLIHGWFGDKNTMTFVKDAYLKYGNFNVIIVDWSSASKNVNYIYSRMKVPEVGQKVAEFIDYLHLHGKMPFNTLYLMGHSLGGHIVGLTGKKVKTGRINTIFGLDPASVLFSVKQPQHRLANTDAEYVESIHTNSQFLGFRYPLGTASFYPNGGKRQPGCPIIDITCSHIRAVDLFVESISENNQFIPLKCQNYEEVRKLSCSGTEMRFKMGGEPSNYNKANGLYYLSTNSDLPFGVGSSYAEE